MGASFALVSAAVLIADYYVQLSVIQPSLTNGETDSVAMLTQYNPHGIFIAVEELGHLALSLSFLFSGLSLGRAGLEKWARRVFFAGFL